MRWSERPPAVRSRFASLPPRRFEPRALSVAVAHLILVRWTRAEAAPSVMLLAVALDVGTKRWQTLILT